MYITYTTYQAFTDSDWVQKENGKWYQQTKLVPGGGQVQLDSWESVPLHVCDNGRWLGVENH